MTGYVLAVIIGAVFMLGLIGGMLGTLCLSDAEYRDWCARQPSGRHR